MAHHAQWHFTTGMMIWSTPVFDPKGQWLAFGSLDGFLYLLDPNTGRLLDRVALGGDVKSSPATDGQGNLYVGASDNRLHALRVTSTLKWQKRWDFLTGGEDYASPALKNQHVTKFVAHQA